jgi:hypothetical protein
MFARHKRKSHECSSSSISSNGDNSGGITLCVVARARYLFFPASHKGFWRVVQSHVPAAKGCPLGCACFAPLELNLYYNIAPAGMPTRTDLWRMLAWLALLQRRQSRTSTTQQ